MFKMSPFFWLVLHSIYINSKEGKLGRGSDSSRRFIQQILLSAYSSPSQPGFLERVKP